MSASNQVPCPSCNALLESGWKFCPSCGQTLETRCQCGQALEATWKVCPACGTPTTSPVPPDPELEVDLGPFNDAREMAWSLFAQLGNRFNEPFHPLATALNTAQAPTVLLNAREPRQYARACSTGLTALLEESTNPAWPRAVRAAIPELRGAQANLMALLEPTVQLIRDRELQVRAINLPELAIGPRPAQQKASGSSVSWEIGEFVLGDLIFPGAGFLVGKAVSAWYSDQQVNEHQQSVLEAYDAAFAKLQPTLIEVLGQAWNCIVDAVRTKGGPELPRHTFFVEAERETSQWHETLTADVSSYATVKEHLERWGPNPNVVRSAFLGCLSLGWAERGEETQSWLALMTRLFPGLAETHEAKADWTLARGKFPEALELIDGALKRWPQFPGLLFSRAETLAALQRDEEAKAVVQLLEKQPFPVDPWVAIARGAHRGGPARTSSLVGEWVKARQNPPHVLRYLREDPYLKPHFKEIAESVPELRPLIEGTDSALATIVKTYLAVDDSVTFHKLPPGEKGKNAVEAFLKLHYKEKVLYFYDWSFWKNGKTGFVLTTQRIIWQVLWDPTVTFKLDKLSPEEIKVEGTVLTVKDVMLDFENAELAEAMGTTIVEMLQVLQTSEAK